jgi:hypothetical protein
MRAILPKMLSGSLAGALITNVMVAHSWAQDLSRRPGARGAVPHRCTKIEPLPGTPSMPVGYFFGFVEPTDAGDPCTWELVSENNASGGKRDGRYVMLTSKTEISHTYTHNVSLSFSAFTSYVGWSNVAALSGSLASVGDGVAVNKLDRLAFDGLSGELFVRVLERAPGQPWAATLAVEPRWARIDVPTGFRADSYRAEFKLLMDVVLTERWFAAVNLNYALGTQKFDLPDAAWTRASAAAASAALTAQLHSGTKSEIIQQAFAGIQGLYVSLFDGLALDRLTGHAFFFGPTLAFTFSGERSLTLAWMPQIAGHARSALARGALDLDNFSRHELRLKWAMPITP